MTQKRNPRLFLAECIGLALSVAVQAQTPEPLASLPLKVDLNAPRVVLGQRLFHDPQLSDQGQRSCASCHPLDSGGMDGKVRAESADGVSLLRNTPSLFNVSFNYFFNWDGVVTTLEAHTEKVMLNPNIMNAKWPELIERLRAVPDYVDAFSRIYPDGLTKANVVDALSNFERSLVTPNARFDRFLRGDTAALDAEEQQGYRLFNALGCVACHQGVNLGGNLFQKFGIFGTPKGEQDPVDEGRYNVTGNDRDRGVFRVPSLRNVAVTAPYFHDGRAANLEAAVDTMAEHQLGKRLATKQRDAIVKFLNTLTGEYAGRALAVNKKTNP
ncbi:MULTISPECIES: cytochrome-c peroxidase [Methylomonas]|uniref:Cytochrome B6 n=2 Tax=Methylomonas TaxID=416 RepID=A0A126T134_9GAMM|nr:MULTISPECIES: cytochrome c peroxidase [Methylomonas]AMK75792.1 cytochrome B6 [Methylomonas denitrificans]OAH98547.1 cytochrome B6 [Methylomonas methanica]